MLDPSVSILVLLVVGLLLSILIRRIHRDQKAATALQRALAERGARPIVESTRELLEHHGLLSDQAQSQLIDTWKKAAAKFGVDDDLLLASDGLLWLGSQSDFAQTMMYELDEQVRAALVMDADRIAFMGPRAAKCSGCRYDLSGLRPRRCPECGRVLLGKPETWGDACLILAGVFR